MIAIYHYSRPEKNDETTRVIWEDKDSLMAYRQGELIKEAIAFENKRAPYIVPSSLCVSLAMTPPAW
ncbi:MAG: hypothetical protein ABSG57_12890 [Candidatus Bathyarchaeia archaeon]